MEKRLEFQCWNCPQTYTLLRTFDENTETLFVACPFCGAEGVVELEPFKKKATTVYRSISNDESEGEMVLELPETLPTHKP